MESILPSELFKPEPLGPNEIILVTSGDLRHSANREGWQAQKEMEEKLRKTFEEEGYHLLRGHPYNEELGHGFIYSQRMGMNGMCLAVFPFFGEGFCQGFW